MKMKKSFITIAAVLLVIAAIAALGLSTIAVDSPLDNLFFKATSKQGYTSDELLVLTEDFVSSEKITVSGGDTVWFGPCETTQYFQLVGLGSDGSAATDKIRGKELEIADTFNNGTVIYKYTVPSGVSSLVFSAPAQLADVYTVTNTELTELLWRAYWGQQGVDTDAYVGESSYYETAQGDKLYFGAVTEASALTSKLYNRNGELIGTMAQADLKLVESFGGKFGIYCYAVPADVAYVYVTYDSAYEQYYVCKQVEKDAAVSDEEIVNAYIDEIGVSLPMDSTVKTLSGKTALFLGDSITYGARDRANIYGAGGWAGRIGYYADMDVTNNGVSGACISTARKESNSEAHYIYNNLVKTNGTTYDYVIMHGLFNDASEGVAVGTMQGKTNFDPAKADVTTYAGGLELLFYQARVQNPNAILGFIVNFQTERTVDQAPYVEMAIQICENWGIEYLDLYHNEGFSVEFDDGLHPSSAGYDSMYTVVANWMATLDGDINTTSSSTKVMSYNVYFGGDAPASAGVSIANRTRKVLDLIAQESPDILMMQEFTNNTFGPAFDTAFEGVYERSGTTHWATGDEMAPVAWKTDKYTLVAGDTIRVEDPDYPRAINWVVLQDKQGKKLLAMSVHGQPDKDGESKESVRNETMALVAEQVAQLRAQYGDIPAVIGGDFNMSIGCTAYNALTNGGLVDVRGKINPKSIGSYNAWTREESKFAMGDYLFISAGVNATSYQVLTNDLDTGRTDGKTVHISDHCPIVIQIDY